MKYLPGLALAALLAVIATFLAEWVGVGLLGYENSPVSAVLMAVSLGLLVRNTLALPAAIEPGLQLCVKRLLRIGIALLGIRLSLMAVASLGLVALPIIVACIAAALLLVMGLARLLHLPPRLGLLIAAGTSICGITAIVAVAPVIEADENETSYAVATIALFGMAALFAYPFLSHLLFTDATQVGMFLGTAIHDTSQVIGAALAYQEQFLAPETLDAAVVTKLVRNLSMIAVIPLIGLIHPRVSEGRRRAGSQAESGGAKGNPAEGNPAEGDPAEGDPAEGDPAEGNAAEGNPAKSEPAASRSGATRRAPVVPLFIVGFLAMAVLRTIGDLGDPAFGFLPAELWERGIAIVQSAAEIGLLLAMAAVGLGTTLRDLYVLGLKPLSVGFAAALAVGGVSATLIHLLAAAGLL